MGKACCSPHATGCPHGPETTPALHDTPWPSVGGPYAATRSQLDDGIDPQHTWSGHAPPDVQQRDALELVSGHHAEKQSACVAHGVCDEAVERGTAANSSLTTAQVMSAMLVVPRCVATTTG